MGSRGIEVRENVPLAPLTTMGVGGAASYFVRAESGEGVAAAADWARERGLPLLALGRGSNMLVADEGFPGLVLQVAIPGMSARRDGDAVEVTAGAGERWNRLAHLAVARGWAGVECMVGIPGLVGATPMQNVGAYGQEVSEIILRVEAFDLRERRLASFGNAECAFGYRESRFKGADRDRYIILSVTYRLLPGAPPTVHYLELERKLAEWDIAHPTLRQVRRAVLEIRRDKSMLLSSRNPNSRSVGSFFMNPRLDEEQMAALDEVIDTRFPGQRIPRFSRPGGGVKIPAAWLIERSGFQRGHVEGAVGLSQHHVLAIINRGGATAHEILALARHIRARVQETFGITLTPEPTLIGLRMEGDE